MTTLTVSMPTYRTPDTLRRAVESVLSQTYRDLTLVVTNDGGGPETWDPIADIADPRLICFDLPENRGRYFCDTVVAQACETPWFTVHDSDDWSAPRRYERMMTIARTHKADVVPGVETIHQPGKLRIRPPQMRATKPLMHHWHMSALYRTEVFRRISSPSFRVGYDSLMSSLLARNRDVKVVPSSRYPDYHRVGRVGSLTTAPETGIGSMDRRQEIARLMEILAELPPGKFGWAELREVLAAALVPEDWQAMTAQMLILKRAMRLLETA